MNIKTILKVSLVTFVFFLPLFVSANNDYVGKIVIETDKNGEAWYVNPITDEYNYLGKPDQAYAIMKENSLVVGDEELENGIPKMLSGLFVQGNDSLFYLDPKDFSMFEIKNEQDAFNLMKNHGVGIENLTVDLGAEIKLTEKKESLDLSDYEILSAWWGRIKQNYTPVREGPSNTSLLKGYLWPVNRVKILSEVEGEEYAGSKTWYMIDGGAHPGSFVHSSFVAFIKQPFPAIDTALSEELKNESLWIDVNLAKNVLTVFKDSSPIFSTYFSPGTYSFPTVTGVFRVKTKLLATRMAGGPPKFPQAYDLKNVPHTMYYHGSFAIHGTYWHDKFGSRQSHGCTNLTQGDAEYVFSKTQPVINGGQKVTLASQKELGTLIYNHY